MSETQAKAIYYMLMNPASANWEGESEKRREAFRGLIARLNTNDPLLDEPLTLRNLLELVKDFPLPERFANDASVKP